MPPEGQIFTGHKAQYSVTALRPIAFGRTSVIWPAVSEKGDELIIKLMIGTPRSAKQRDALSEFERETETHSRLSHQNILPILDWGVDSEALERAPFLVLPFCKYGDLRQAISTQSFIPFDRAIPILRQLAGAVDYAHSCGILHGDIKPENVLFWRSQDHACFADFGAARYYPQSLAISAPTVGTPDYLSPEELDGVRATPASDLYSFALLSYEMLTGVLPFDHSVAFHSMQARLHGELKNALIVNPLLPSRVDPAFIAAFAVDPGKRPRSATLFVQSLLTEPLASSLGILVTPNGDVSRGATGVEDVSRFTPEQRIKLWTVIIGAIVAILTALIAIFPSLLPKQSSSHEASPGPRASQSSPARDSSRVSP